MGIFDLFKKKEKVQLNVELGELKKLDDISLEDMKNYPVWVNDLSGENIEEFDETSERPIINNISISKHLVKKFVSVTVLTKIENSEDYATVNYERDGTFVDLCPWKDGKWSNIQTVFPELGTIKLESLVEIEGIKLAKINYDLQKDKGELIKGV